MATNQEGVHAAIRASTGTARDYIADWHALFDDASIASGTFNERLLAWINAQLSSSYVSLPTAMQAYAVDAGFARWSDINTLSLGGGAVSLAETLAGSETDALAIVYTDTYHKATSGFNGSVYCLDSGTPANDYGNSPTTEAASYFTYTSPSPKMILHDDGVLKYNAHNLLAIPSEDFSGAGWTENAIGTIAAPSTTGPDGETSGTVITASSGSAAHCVYNSATIAVAANAQYRATCNFKAGTHDYVFLTLGGSGETRVGAVFDLSAGDGTATETDVGTTSGTLISTQLTSLGGGWYRASLVCSSNQTNVYFVAGFAEAATGNTFDVTQQVTFNAAGTETIEIHGAHLHRYPADTTYLKTTSSARFADPIEFNSSGTALGALVEPQRTNLLTYSSQFDNASWSKSNSSISANATTSPAGTTTADTLVENTSNTTHTVAKSYSVTGTGPFTQSIFVKAAGRTAIYIRWYFTSNEWEAAVFNLADGTNSQNASGSSTPVTNRTQGIEDYGDGWYRCWLSGTIPSGKNLQANVHLTDKATGHTFNGFGDYSYTGDGSSGVHLWGAQLEAGSSATSPIETYGSTVTRAADNISKATSAFPAAGSAQTLYVEFANVGVGDGTPEIIETGGVGAGTFAAIYDNGQSGWFAAGLSASGSFDADAGDTNRIAYAMASSDAAESTNGGTVQTSASTDWTGSITTFQIGGRTGGTRIAHAHIKSILYLPRRVSNADLQTLTSTGALP